MSSGSFCLTTPGNRRLGGAHNSPRVEDRRGTRFSRITVTVYSLTLFIVTFASTAPSTQSTLRGTIELKKEAVGESIEYKSISVY